jgi:nitroreductase
MVSIANAKSMRRRSSTAPRNLDFFGAPHAVFVFMAHPFDTREATDLGMYAQTLMLALTARGIASCAQGALGLYPDIVREVLHLPAEQRLLFGVSFGYEDTADKANAARVGRAAPHEAVRFHR